MLTLEEFIYLESEENTVVSAGYFLEKLVRYLLLPEILSIIRCTVATLQNCWRWVQQVPEDFVLQ
jgi:hypothetical protein